MDGVDPEARARTDDLSKAVLWALPFAGALVAAAGLATLLRAVAPGPRFSLSAAFAVLASLGLAGYLAITRKRRPRAGILAACHALVWAPFLAVTAWSSIDEPIVNNTALRCGTGLMSLLVFGMPVAGVVLFIGGIVAGIVLAKRGTDRVVRSVAFGATALALVAFAFAAVRMQRPDPDTYLASLAPAAVLEPGDRATVDGRELRYDRTVGQKIPSRSDAESGAPYDPARIDCTLTGYEEQKPFYALSGACPTVRVRVDTGHDLAFADERDVSYGPVYAFRPSTGVSMTIAPKDVADHIAPPIGWTAGAGLGGLFGALFLLAATRARRRAAEIVGQEGKHHGGGLVALATGESIRLDSAVGLPLGDVVLREPTEKLASYRQMGASSFSSASPGTLDGLRAAHTDLAASLSAAALAASVLGATPLLVARLVAGL